MIQQFQQLVQENHNRQAEHHQQTIDNGGFEVHIKTLSGKTFTVSCLPSDKVIDMKEKIYDREGIPPDHQRIIFEGKQLENHRCVLDYHLNTTTTQICACLVLKLVG